MVEEARDFEKIIKKITDQIKDHEKKYRRNYSNQCLTALKHNPPVTHGCGLEPLVG